MGKILLCQKYLEYLHPNNTSVFTTISPIKQAKLHGSIVIIDKVSILGNVIYSSTVSHCEQYEWV